MDNGLSHPFRYTDQRLMKLELSLKESQLLNNFDFDEPIFYTIRHYRYYFLLKVRELARRGWLTRP